MDGGAEDKESQRGRERERQGETLLTYTLARTLSLSAARRNDARLDAEEKERGG